MAENVPPLPDEEPIAIEGLDSAESSSPTSVRAFVNTKAGMNLNKSAFKRPLNNNGQGATRCRVFHTRVAAAALEHMESQINQWLDGENIEIKHVGHLMGVLEGKTPEPNMFVMVWY